jgi:vacuolar protein sorting-associated protein 54
VEERSYFTVPATQEMLLLLTDYLRVIVNLSLLTTDTMSRVIEFLKAFNSRTCQVVLGAGAMRSAGLKNITAKHLALASQSLSVVIALIPYVRETFRRHLSSKQAVMLVEFDKLKRDYQEHQNEIHAKLIAIMGDRLSAHIKSLNTIRWDAPAPKPGTNEYMELLVKETVTLHKVLSRYLASAVVEVRRNQLVAPWQLTCLSFASS